MTHDPTLSGWLVVITGGADDIHALHHSLHAATLVGPAELQMRGTSWPLRLLSLLQRSPKLVVDVQAFETCGYGSSWTHERWVFWAGKGFLTDAAELRSPMETAVWVRRDGKHLDPPNPLNPTQLRALTTDAPVGPAQPCWCSWPRPCRAIERTTEELDAAFQLTGGHHET